MKHNQKQIRKLIKEKVEGRVIARHTDTGHFYELENGSIVASTTSKLIIEKPHLRNWAVKKGIEWLEVGSRWENLQGPNRNEFMTGAIYAHTDERDIAGGVGSLAHDVTENYIKYWLKNGKRPVDIRQGFPANPDPRSVAAARSVEAFLLKYDIIPLASELLVGSIKRKSAGTLDFLCLMDDKLTLIDFKTSNQVSDDYALQVSDYAYMFKEMTGLKIEKVIILHLSKDYDKFHAYSVPRLRDAYNAFCGLSKCYDWLHNNNKKLVEIKKRLIIT